jgi:hypothetical protein
MKRIIELNEKAGGQSYDKSKGILTLTVIEAGISKNNRYYSPQLLKESASMFEGAKMFVDHATDKEEQARPEGSLQNWVAVLDAVVPEDNGTLSGMATVIDPAFKAKLETLAAAGHLRKMGVSIRAFGEATKGTVNGQDCMIIEKFTGVRSVDFVTFAGAGGYVETLESATPEARRMASLKESMYESYKLLGLSHEAARLAAGLDIPKVSQQVLWPGFNPDEVK